MTPDEIKLCVLEVIKYRADLASEKKIPKEVFERFQEGRKLSKEKEKNILIFNGKQSKVY